jgi:sarcosine oxidase subunit beta
MSTFRESEAVVIGAGAVGTSIAYHLAKRGKQVAVVDRGGVCSGTSSATFAIVWVHAKEPLHYMELNLTSAELYPKVVAELDEDVLLEQPGGLTLCMTEEELANSTAQIERQSKSPRFKGVMIDARRVHELQKGVSEEVVGAVHSPHEGHIDSIRYVTALARAARKLGVHFKTYTEVKGIELKDGAVSGVITTEGRIRTSVVVNAGGPYAQSVSNMAGLNMPLKAIRGQVIVTLPVARFQWMPMSTVRQAPTGQFFMGATYEDVGYDKRITYEGVRSVLSNAVRKVPAVKDTSVLRIFSGLRPMPPDDLPYLGSVKDIPGFYVAATHSGITLSPVLGKVISELVCDDHTDIPLDHYDPMRFHQTAPA